MKKMLLRPLLAALLFTVGLEGALANPIAVGYDYFSRRRPSIVVRFVANGGKIGESHGIERSSIEKKYEDGSEFLRAYNTETLPVPKRYGYVFEGWYTEASKGVAITSEFIHPGSQLSPWRTFDREIVVYAHWRIIWRQGDFTGRLYRQLAKGDGNLVFSPYGVGSVCALMATGAKGKTLDAFVKTLGLPASNPDEIAHVFGCEKRRLGGTVELSDSIWLFNGFKPCDEFRSRAVKVFLAEARKTVGGYAAMREINDYVNKKTHGKIPQPLQSPPSKDTAMAAVDTVYLKAIWEQPFQPAKTRVKKFTTLSGKCVEVPFMDDDIFCAGYYKTNGLAVLALPYRDCGLEMMFLLPDKNVALSRIEALLSESFINEIVPRLLHKGDTYPIGKAEPCPDKDGEYFIVGEEYGGTSVCIPKFEFEVRHDLREALDSMGLGIAFAQKLADFSGITPSPGLGLSDVGQVAKIKVDEVGTEAGAGTAALYVGCVMPDFVADRPFIFLLRDAKSGSIFFAGRVTDPSMK